MTGINVLSTGAPVKPKEGYSVSEKSQQASDITMDFAAIFGGWITQVSGQGQDSGISQSNDPAGKEANSGRNTLLGFEGLQQALVGTLQGYGNPQGVLAKAVQGEQNNALEGANLKAGEVPAIMNSLDKLLAQFENLKRDDVPASLWSKLEEAYRAGKSEQPQGKLFPNSELDLYKDVISELLQELSGEIQDERIKPQAIHNSIQQKLELVVQRMNSGLFSTSFEGTMDAKEINVKSTQIEHGAQRVQVNPSAENTQGSQGTLGILNTFMSQGEKPPIPNTIVNYQEERPTERILAKNSTASEVKITSEKSAVVSFIQDNKDVTSEQIGTSQLTNEPRSIQENKGTSSQISLKGSEGFEAELIRKQEPNTIKPTAQEAMNYAPLSTKEKALSKGILTEKENSSPSSRVEESDTPVLGAEGHGLISSAKEISPLQTKLENKPDLPIWAQVARDIHEKAFQARPRLHELDINLHPAELGQIRISLTWEDGRVHLRMTATETSTGQVLQANLPELRENLAQSGIQCGMLEMGLGNQQQNSRQQQEQASKQSHQNPVTPQELESIHELAALSGRDSIETSTSSSRINVTA